ncbi:GtrA-like protein [Caballeronia terrestris]|uniref:GtrA-like protein n=1 Tax=Caballeronia terrestris TaxID=1226301 RepID=A0A158KTX8_9BURK|nr:GtrA family protein [Caballeronia terrestris]SAL84173.1 GtrA-like protein [Caballeronia terrestris]
MSPISQRTGSAGRSTTTLAIIYALLAGVAMVANIGAQDISLNLYNGPYSVPVSVFVGTIVGLIVKYTLDKRFIFSFKPTSAAHDARTFVLYSLMGIVTTIIFWAFEFAFDHIFHTKSARFTGGAIGLAIGYVTKYLLDRKFVFVDAPSARR